MIKKIIIINILLISFFAIGFGVYWLVNRVNPFAPEVGNLKDAYGCNTTTGYSYDAKVGGCIRPWVLDESQKEGAGVAVRILRVNGEISSKGVYVLNVTPYKCSGCYDVYIDAGKQTVIKAMLNNYEISSVAQVSRAQVPAEIPVDGAEDLVDPGFDDPVIEDPIDSTDPIEIPEEEPGQEPIVVNPGNYRCPKTKWIDCMPSIGASKPECATEYSLWIKQNCPDFEGIAY